MKKLYIPTTTLNFNNVLSSESISPKSFYEKRGFGYSRWMTIPENPFDNCIVLYDYIGNVVRPKSELEDHPLLIEVELDENMVKSVGDGMYMCDHTIYLTPTSTRFLFFSDLNLKITYSMSESSLETKLWGIYHKKIEILQNVGEPYKIINVDDLSLNTDAIKSDIKINKLKGLLYGYFIGKLLSMSIDDVKCLNAYKEIHNIFAAILSSFSKQPTVAQDERLEELFSYINGQTPFYQKLSVIVDNENVRKQVLNLIRETYGEVRDEVNKTHYLSYLRSNNEENENTAISWIKSKILDSEKGKGKYGLSTIGLDDLIVVDGLLHSVKGDFLSAEVEDTILKTWINSTLLKNEYNGRISTYREVLATDITKETKSVCGDELWGKSTYKTRLNNLRHFIAGDNVELEWGKDFISALSAVVLYGENWEKLLSFMQSKEITDYGLAFALYGELHGFSNLTRDFTDVLYSQPDRGSLWNVYREIYGQLLGEKLPDLINIEKEGDTESLLQKDSETVKMETIKEKVDPIMNEFFGSDEFTGLGVAANWYKKELMSLSYIDADDFLSQMKKLGKKKDAPKSTKRKWDKCVKFFGKAISESSKNQAKEEPLLFDVYKEFPIGDSFYCDVNIMIHIEKFLPEDSSIRNQFKEDLEWFQNNYKESYYDKKKGKQEIGLYKSRNKENAAVIDNFGNYCSNKVNLDVENPKMKYLSDRYRKIDIQKIIDFLKKEYKVNV
ncbi:MAG: hypothetical protein MJZ23_00160 [Paludibacteraceae bacterium]|nr:hypothetical protein [Paludibacteraceae bacterium]